MKDKHYLIKHLLDRTMDLGVRDDCAMDLADYESEEVFEALYKCGSDSNEDKMIQSSCGESLAEIMVRLNKFLPKYASGLSSYADGEFRAHIKNNKPEWL